LNGLGGFSPEVQQRSLNSISDSIAGVDVEVLEFKILSFTNERLICEVVTSNNKSNNSNHCNQSIPDQIRALHVKFNPQKLYELPNLC
jgi:hypothetical protein